MFTIIRPWPCTSCAQMSNSNRIFFNLPNLLFCLRKNDNGLGIKVKYRLIGLLKSQSCIIAYKMGLLYSNTEKLINTCRKGYKTFDNINRIYSYLNYILMKTIRHSNLAFI